MTYSQTYTTPGSYTFLVPTGVTTFTIVAIGGGGGGANVESRIGGNAAQVTTTITGVTSPTLKIIVGGGGGFYSDSGGGGGLTSIFGTGVNIIAGGGGGAGRFGSGGSNTASDGAGGDGSGNFDFGGGGTTSGTGGAAGGNGGAGGINGAVGGDAVEGGGGGAGGSTTGSSVTGGNGSGTGGGGAGGANGGGGGRGNGGGGGAGYGGGGGAGYVEGGGGGGGSSYVSSTSIPPTTYVTANIETYGQGGGIGLGGGGGYVSITWTDPTPVPIPVSNICFLAGTPIKTDQGIVPIDKIDVMYHTIGNKVINYITQTVTVDKYLVLFKKNCLGRNWPSQDTIMTKDHKVLYKGELAPAYKFMNISPDVKKYKYNGEILYNVLMETHETMNVNNLICETLHPHNIIAKLYRSNFTDYHNDNVIVTMNYSLYKRDLPGYKKMINRLQTTF
jgi:hypothetical protein